MVRVPVFRQETTHALTASPKSLQLVHTLALPTLHIVLAVTILASRGMAFSCFLLKSVLFWTSHTFIIFKAIVRLRGV